ncbi:hypothetical protein ABT104_04280 [Streptomyces mobaraensis]|uniref:hypothetical protein n=1 Tax=Streptomyces mobaraensis TaxID=35621 RepID=UPI00331B1E74
MSNVEGGVPAGGFQISWLIPPAFNEIPVDIDDIDEAAERLFRIVTDLRDDEDEQVKMYVLLAHAIDELRSAGAVYAGMCAMSRGGRPTMATVVAYLMPAMGNNATEALHEAFSGLQEAYPEDDVRIADLPCGQGVVRIGDSVFELPEDMSPIGEAVDIPRGQIQVYVPLPNDAEILTLELSTPSMEDWDFYSEMFAGIVKSLRLRTVEEVRSDITIAQAVMIPAAKLKAEVRQALHFHSSRILDALEGRGTASQDSRAMAAVCLECLSVGLEIPCCAVHRWCIEETPGHDPSEVMTGLNGRLQAGGWISLTEARGAGLMFMEESGFGHRVDMALRADRKITVEVTSPCVQRSGEAQLGLTWFGRRRSSAS